MKELLKNLTPQYNSNKLVKDFMEAMKTTHRTEQASIIRNIKDCLIAYANEANTDLRNQAAKEFCQSIEDHYIPYI